MSQINTKWRNTVASTFDTKFEAVLDKSVRSAKDHIHLRPLSWVVIVAVLSFIFIKEVFAGLLEATENCSPNDDNEEKRADLEFAQNNFEGQRDVSLDLFGRVPGEYGYGNPLIPPDDTDEEQGW